MMNHEPQPLPMAYGAPKQAHGFNPYEDNGGSLVAIAGEDYAIIGCDTRLSAGFNILTRDQTKLFRLTNQTVLASSGCWCDCVTFNKFLEARLKRYNYEHNQDMSTNAVSQCCATMLYGRRFFPYYVWNLLAGIDENGKGAVYAYDPVGHMERKPYAAGGSSSALIMPFLDSIVGKKNQTNPDPNPMPKDKAILLVKDIFISAAERDIHCGDAIHLMVITKNGIEEIHSDLRKD